MIINGINYNDCLEPIRQEVIPPLSPNPCYNPCCVRAVLTVTKLPSVENGVCDLIYRNETDNTFWALNSEGTDWVQVSGSATQVQSDWDVTEDSSPAYIKNKPNLYTKEQVDEMIRRVKGVPHLEVTTDHQTGQVASHTKVISLTYYNLEPNTTYNVDTGAVVWGYYDNRTTFTTGDETTKTINTPNFIETLNNTLKMNSAKVVLSDLKDTPLVTTFIPNK